MKIFKIILLAVAFVAAIGLAFFASSLKKSNVIFEWDPDVTVGSTTIPFNITVVPDPTIQSSTIFLVVGTTTAPSVTSTVSSDWYRVTATVVNNANSSTVESIYETFRGFSTIQTSTFPLAMIPRGSYTMTIDINLQSLGDSSVTKSFSF